MEWIKSVTVETALTPPVTVDGADLNGSGPPNPLLALIRPRFTVSTALGTRTFAPWGSPSDNYWPQIQIGLVVIAGLLAWRLVKK